VLEIFHVWELPGPGQQRAHYLVPGRIAARVQYAAARMGGLARHGQPAPMAIEFGPMLYKFQYVSRALFN
jgi:hypothetical protein